MIVRVFTNINPENRGETKSFKKQSLSTLKIENKTPQEFDQSQFDIEVPDNARVVDDHLEVAIILGNSMIDSITADEAFNFAKNTSHGFKLVD